jgi:hypothetical protein
MNSILRLSANAREWYGGMGCGMTRGGVELPCSRRAVVELMDGRHQMARLSLLVARFFLVGVTSFAHSG